MLIGKDKIEQFLNDEGINDYIESPKNGIKKKFAINSPFCSDTEKKCVIWFNSGKFRCYKSGEEGSFFQFIKFIKNYSSFSEAKMYFLKNYWKGDFKELFSENKNTEEFEKEESSINLPENAEEFNKELHKEYFNYLNKRIKETTIDRLKLFIDIKEKRIIFPVYNINNELVYYTGRSINPDNKLRWKDSVSPYKAELFYEWNSSQIIYLTEGIFDALKIQGGISILGAYLSDINRKKILNKKPYKIILVFDNDSTGKETQIKSAADFLSDGFKNIYLWNWKHPEINKYKDFGEIPYKILENPSDYYYKFDLSGFLKWKIMNLKDFESEQKERIKRIIKNIKL